MNVPATTSSPMRYQLSSETNFGFIDYLQIETCGLIRIEGWKKDPDTELIETPSCLIDDIEVPLLQYYQTYRPDVARSMNSPFNFFGIVFEYYFPKEISKKVSVKITLGEKVLFKNNIPVHFVAPAYSFLLDTNEVQKRKDIYAEGLPVNTVSNEVYSLVQGLKGSVLDFGCGVGHLVKYFSEQKIDTYGIELNRTAIRQNILPEVKDKITLYNGSNKLPFRNNQFQNCLAIEVLEHIPSFELVLDEIARTTARTFIVTVPDMASIPISHYQLTVPWHLLEATHVNFFTQKSLYAQLKKRFRKVNMGKIGQVETNDAVWHVSLCAVCHK